MVFGKTLYALDGLKALELIDVEDLDLIITDIQMPNMNGIKLIEELKNKDIAIPVVVVTATMKKNINKIKELGIEDILQKPINVNELIVTCEEAIKNPKKI